MNLPPIVSPREWKAAREELLVEERRSRHPRRACREAPADAEDGGREGGTRSRARTGRRAWSTCSRGAAS